MSDGEFSTTFKVMIEAKDVKIDESEFRKCLAAQFLAAGDSQYVGKEDEENPIYHVNEKWLMNFYQIIMSHNKTNDSGPEYFDHGDKCPECQGYGKETLCHACNFTGTKEGYDSRRS